MYELNFAIMLQSLAGKLSDCNKADPGIYIQTMRRPKSDFGSWIFIKTLRGESQLMTLSSCLSVVIQAMTLGMGTYHITHSLLFLRVGK